MSLIMILTIVIIVSTVVGAGAGLLKAILEGKEDYAEALSKEAARRARRKAQKPPTFVRKNGKIYKITRK